MPDLLHPVANGGSHHQVNIISWVQKDVLQNQQPDLCRVNILGIKKSTEKVRWGGGIGMGVWARERESLELFTMFMWEEEI